MRSCSYSEDVCGQRSSSRSELHQLQPSGPTGGHPLAEGPHAEQLEPNTPLLRHGRRQSADVSLTFVFFYTEINQTPRSRRVETSFPVKVDSFH